MPNVSNGQSFPGTWLVPQYASHQEISGIELTCVANALFDQKVVVNYTVGSATGTVTFLGNGENMAMKTADGKDAVSIPNTENVPKENISFAMEFYHKVPGSGDYTPSSSEYTISNGESPDSNTFLFQVTCEDSVDADHNDSVINLTTHVR